MYNLSFESTGIKLGVTVCSVYVEYENKIKEYIERLKMWRRWSYMVDEKIVRKMNHKIVAKEEKDE